MVKSFILNHRSQAIIALFQGFVAALRRTVDNLSQVAVERSVDKLSTHAFRPQQAWSERGRLFFIQRRVVRAFLRSRELEHCKAKTGEEAEFTSCK